MTRLTLTFDNGPEPGTTERILSALRDRKLPATFFMVGERVLDPAGRETALRVRDAGHRIGNHTMTHGAPLGDADDQRVEAEIGGARQALADLGVDGLLFRPNGHGHLGPHLLSDAAVNYLVAGAYTVVTWNCVPRDWEDPNGLWMSRALASLDIRDWTVVVLHDQHARAADHLPEFLDRVQACDVEVRTDFPSSCVPIVGGRIQWDLNGVIANGTTAGAIAHEVGPTRPTSD
jgi:peptidoglycan-N-acetylglucosamine deacetylase